VNDELKTTLDIPGTQTLSNMHTGVGGSGGQGIRGPGEGTRAAKPTSKCRGRLGG